MRGRYKYRENWELFAKYLQKLERPTTFEECWSFIPPKISGQYEVEARALWNNLQKINPTSLVEVGRNLGGTLFMFACACPNLERVVSIDIERYELTDDAFVDWFSHHKIKADILVEDSTKFNTDGMWDFVFIDGGHAGDIVAADIRCWKDNCRYIAFHDYADKGKNKHKRVFKDVVKEINKAEIENGWEQFGERGRSDTCYKTTRTQKQYLSSGHI